MEVKRRRRRKRDNDLLTLKAKRMRKHYYFEVRLRQKRMDYRDDKHDLDDAVDEDYDEVSMADVADSAADSADFAVVASSSVFFELYFSFSPWERLGLEALGRFCRTLSVCAIHNAEDERRTGSASNCMRIV